MIALIVVVTLGVLAGVLMNLGYYVQRAEIERIQAEEEIRLKRQQAEKSSPNTQGSKAIPYQMNGKTYYTKPGDPMYNSIIQALQEENNHAHS